jgi:hypothetical protein
MAAPFQHALETSYWHLDSFALAEHRDSRIGV